MLGPLWQPQTRSSACDSFYRRRRGIRATGFGATVSMRRAVLPCAGSHLLAPVRWASLRRESAVLKKLGDPSCEPSEEWSGSPRTGKKIGRVAPARRRLKKLPVLPRREASGAY